MKKVFQRFVDIWKMDFLVTFVSEKHRHTKTTVGFWIVSNFFIAALLAGNFAMYFATADDKISDVITEYVPQDAKITMSGGQLYTENIDEPFFREITAENDEQSERMVFIVDTKSHGHDITSLDEYAGGVLVLQDRVYGKDGSEINHMLFADVPDFSFTREQVLAFIAKNATWFVVLVTFLVFCMMMLYFSVLRLVSALWWALLLWLCSRIGNYPLSYGVSYKAILNFYFIPTLVVSIVSLVGLFTLPLMTTVIFVLIFVGNFVWIKRNMHTDRDAATCESARSVDAPEAPAKTQDKSVTK